MRHRGAHVHTVTSRMGSVQRLALLLAVFMSSHNQASCFCTTGGASMVLKGAPAAPAPVIPPVPAAQQPKQQLPPQREDDGGVRIQLGAYRAEPFQETTFPAQALYALQQLQSDEEVAFGAAFISLRRTEGTGGTCRWRLGRLNATRVVALHRFKLWWMKPTHGRRGSDVPPETQLLLSEMPPDPETGRRLYSLFIPLLDGPAKCSMKGLPDRIGLRRVSAHAPLCHVNTSRL
eukprot:TRINITY_DN459_c1_g1_i2.p2 TRINITY_DN459_c1_g1~~TRINITY_DN459_c1_g1_i2.p2  ORF type:complete len:255 (+),score=61.78 TRINITY_DN459_c1_g1_i2:68-766(+)